MARLQGRTFLPGAGPHEMASQQIDVVVIGAGAAGLSAAVWLAKRGKRVVVLEGRDRVGGRIWSEAAAGWPMPIEYGAEFVHGGNASFEKWLRRCRLTKTRTVEKHWVVANGDRRPRTDIWDRIDAVMKKIGPRFKGSFAEWLKSRGNDVSKEDRLLAKSFVEGFQGASLAAMSARSLFAATQEPEEQGRIVGGYGRLVSGLRKEAETCGVVFNLQTTVDRVSWRRGAVEVFSGERRWRAATVMVTVPLGVLRAKKSLTGAIRFVPPLEAKERQWRNLPVGHAIRVVFRMKADLWESDVIPAEMRANSGREFGFIHSRLLFFPVWWAESPRPVLVGWTGGPAAAEMTGMTTSAIFKNARRSLATLLGCTEKRLAPLIAEYRTHDWTADPFTRGAYSFSVAGREDAPVKLGRPVANTVFFAGEATADPLELGTVHGAVSSGERAANEIEQATRSQGRRHGTTDGR